MPEYNPAVVFRLVVLIVHSRIGAVSEDDAAVFHDQIGGVLNQWERESRAHGSPPGHETGARWSAFVHEEPKPTTGEREIGRRTGGVIGEGSGRRRREKRGVGVRIRMAEESYSIGSVSKGTRNDAAFL